VPRGAEFWVPAAPIVIGARRPPKAGNLDVFGVFYVVGGCVPACDERVARRSTTRGASQSRQPGRLKWGEAPRARCSDYVFGPVRALRLLWIAVGVLLLIACSQRVGLDAARVARRRHEDAIRLALGAGARPWRACWLTEIGLVATRGGAGLLARPASSRDRLAAPDDTAAIARGQVTRPVAAFTFAVVVAVALVTGLMPLRQAGAVSLVDAIEGERTTSSRQTLRLRSALLVAQIAMSVVLLVGAGLLVRSFVELRRTDLGFTTNRVVSMTVRRGQRPRCQTAGCETCWRGCARCRESESAGAVYLRPLMLGAIGDGVHVFLEVSRSHNRRRIRIPGSITRLPRPAISKP
jgi:hypothetical protein